MRDRWSDERLDDLKTTVDDGFRRMDEQFARIDGKFDHLDARIDSLTHGVMYGCFALSAAMIGGFAAILTRL